MSTFHYHNVYCPHCGDVAFQHGCRRVGCSFATCWREESEVPEEHEEYYEDTCPYCREVFYYVDGR